MGLLLSAIFFFFNDTATTEIYTLSLHDALPIAETVQGRLGAERARPPSAAAPRQPPIRSPHGVSARREDPLRPWQSGRDERRTTGSRWTGRQNWRHRTDRRSMSCPG